MKVIGNLKEKLDKTESRIIIEDAGVALTDDELEKVSGGVEDKRHPGTRPPHLNCPDEPGPHLEFPDPSPFKF